MRKRPNPSIFGKAKKKVKEGEARDRAAKILHDLVEPMIDDFNSMDELESYMSDNMPDFYKGRDTNKAIEDAITYEQPELDFNDIRKSPFRAIRMEDRIKKLVSINKFTI